MPDTLRRVPCGALAFAVVVLALAAYLPFAPVRLYDYRAFYCAGRAVAAHADPYREGALRACERATSVPLMPPDDDDVTVPAPLPGYALALFAVLAALPFGISVGVWIGASAAALAATIALLRRTLALPVAALTVALAVPAAVVAIPLGQPAPFVGLAIALCAWALARDRPQLAAAAALVTALDPPIAIVLCATLLVAVPPTRAIIVTGTVALLLLSLATLGAQTNLEYVQSVLHEHAAGNVAERSQFSTTHFCWVAGVPSAAALTIGNCWYALAGGAGVMLARRLGRRYGAAAYALVPPACAVFGGLYVHYSQLVLAIPAYLMIAAPAWPSSRWLRTSIFVLAVPWLALAAFPPFGCALVAAALVYARPSAAARAGLRLGLGSAALLLLLFGIALAGLHPTRAGFRSASAPAALVERGWSRYVAWRDPTPSLVVVALQMPTVLAFTGCFGWLVRAAWARRAPRGTPAAG